MYACVGGVWQGCSAKSVSTAASPEPPIPSYPSSTHTHTEPSPCLIQQSPSVEVRRLQPPDVAIVGRCEPAAVKRPAGVESVWITMGGGVIGKRRCVWGVVGRGWGDVAKVFVWQNVNVLLSF